MIVTRLRFPLLFTLLALFASSNCACPPTGTPDGGVGDGDGDTGDGDTDGGTGDGDGDGDGDTEGSLGSPCEGPADCDSLSCFGGTCTECSGPSQCEDGETCLDGTCVPDAACAEGEQCGAGGTCCPGDGECLGSVCRAPCATLRCGPDQAECCAAGDVCYGGGCRTPGVACVSAADCGDGEVCELDLGVCLPDEVVGTCEYIPEAGVFSPAIECRWTADSSPVTPNRNDVVMAPVVGNLTDDNGDGVTDRFDIPEVVFITYDYEDDGCCNQPGTLRIVKGACNDDGTMETLASITDPIFENSGGLALGDLDGDGVMEIVGPTVVGGTVRGTAALKRTSDDGTAWELLWHNPDYPAWDVHTRGGTQVALADLDGDGTVEVIVGNVVLDGATGDLEWDGVVTSGGTGGIGNNAFMGPVSTAADLDGDGEMEVLAGNTAYDSEGNVLWTFTYTTQGSPCGGQLPCDGYTAAANMNDTPEGEVVIVRQGEVFVLDHEGNELARVPIPIDDCANNESGPPTIADFDGDGRAEVGTAAGDFYVVVDLDCTDPLPAECLAEGVLWAVPNEDCTSRVTASSVFDFEGDGAAEVVYADEDTFRILRGTDGFELFVDETHGSHTRLEMAVIADVDNDGNAEVVIAENAYQGGTPGVEIWGDTLDNWVFTRRIWNQHSYHVTNITEDGEVTGPSARNWAVPSLNNFRQNTQGDGVFWAPDLVLSSLGGVCTPTRELTLSITVQNQGSRMVGPGLDVAVYSGPAGGDATDLLGVLTTTRTLFPGSEEELELVADASALGMSFELKLVADDDGTGTGAHNECVEDNNDAQTSISCFFGGG